MRAVIVHLYGLFLNFHRMTVLLIMKSMGVCEWWHDISCAFCVRVCNLDEGAREKEKVRERKTIFCTILRRRCTFFIHFLSITLMLCGVSCSYLATLIRLFGSFIPTTINQKCIFYYQRFINLLFFVERFKFQTDAWYTIHQVLIWSLYFYLFIF